MMAKWATDFGFEHKLLFLLTADLIVWNSRYMAKSNSANPMFAVVGVIVTAGLLYGSYFLGTQQNTSSSNGSVLAATSTPTTASAVASAAYSKCVDNGGFVTTARRGTWGYYQVCNFTDDMTCDLYALYDGDCQVGGVKTIGYSTTDQVFCAQRGGTPQGSNNGQCKMPDGTVCATSSVYKGTCDPN